MARSYKPAQSPSVFQNPVSFPAFLHSIFKNLGWYDISSGGFWGLKWFAPPPFDDTVHNEDDADLMVDSPPADEDAVWEPAVYPPEWPPYPALTWMEEMKIAEACMEARAEEGQTAAWEATREAETKAEIAQEKEEARKTKGERQGVEGGFGKGVRKFLRERLCGGNRKTEGENIEMV
ncbi:hypothetical protein CYLTODRAFT_425673 [Cylindrobasidium torrendii FP15055 ss-10]|uniref:Uncharacterized protein n=1 Tax=Cylindrobasidium torrendii FP15055 ss-10 TaxID=1314674 RepID=A0A0D7B0G1_9AGAR|nr:hypothetical protein CYLTODRAFT_425673 [Cylindrobasidium torrendii FP15055 ss-10]